eukprot:1060461-Rhodomonas_salina.1
MKVIGMDPHGNDLPMESEMDPDAPKTKKYPGVKGAHGAAAKLAQENRLHLTVERTNAKREETVKAARQAADCPQTPETQKKHNPSVEPVPGPSESMSRE